MEDVRKNKIIGSMIGGAIGDALGYPIEFKKGIEDKEISKYGFDGRGIISDDTQMTLFTANGLIWRETRLNMKGIAPTPSDAIYQAYLDWLDTQQKTGGHETAISWIKDIRELNVPRAPGMTCLNALSSGKKGTIEQPINDSKGCGGVMRVAPVGLYAKNPKDAGRIAAEASAITHGHPLGIIPAYVFAVMIYFLVNENLGIKESLDEAIKQYKEESLYNNKTDQSFVDLVDKAAALSKENLPDVRAISEIGEGWVAEEAFAIAVYACLKYSDNFENAIVCAVNHDGDSDSTGAIAGNIMGAYLGVNAIPQYYLNNIELKDTIIELAEDLATTVPVNEYNTNNKKWLDKYLR